VITNDTLIRAGGHFTTTTTQQPLPTAPAISRGQAEAQWLADRRKNDAEVAAAAAAARKAEQLKKLAAARAEQLMAGDTPDALLNDPPPLEGGAIQTMKPVTPPKMQPTPATQPAPNPPL
jgi:hypothetical protein